jgi:serine protease Do
VTTFVEQLQETVDRLATQLGPSIVRIGRGWGRGAGFVIGDGQVLTNAHNLQGPEVTVTFPDGRSAVGTATGVDAEGDLAVIAVDTAGAPAVAFRSGDAAGVGTPVFALANPAGRGLRVTFGLVSAVGQAFRGPRGRRIPGGLEHTAPLSRGSSGSPVVDAGGEVIGINTNRVGDGFYLALPTDAELRNRIDALGRGEEPTRLRLGVALAPSPAARRMRAAVGLPERDGLLVRGVEEGSPAESAGLRQGDLLVKAGDQDLAGLDDLHRALEATAPGGNLALAVVRGVEELEITVSFPES